MGRRILVTGGAGMIGRNLSLRLAAEGHTIHYLCRPSTEPRRRAWLERTGQVLNGDILEPQSLSAAVGASRPDVVFHLAGTAFNARHTSEQHFQTIALGALHLFEALKGCSLDRVVVTGSTAEYGSGTALTEDHPVNPATILGAAKAGATILSQAYARLYGMPNVILRLFMPYGPWENRGRLVPHTILSALAGKDVSMTEGVQQRDFIHVDDVVDALVRAATRPVAPGEIFNIGSGTGTPVRRVVEQILNEMGNPVKALFGAVPTRPDEIMEMSADISKARRELAWEPRVPLTEGLRRSIVWWKDENDR